MVFKHEKWDYLKSLFIESFIKFYQNDLEIDVLERLESLSPALFKDVEEHSKQGQKLSITTKVKDVVRSEGLKVKNQKTSPYHKSDNTGHIYFYEKLASSKC